MALHLITGYAGREHITSADQGAYNIATFGDGCFVLERGRKFAYTVLTNNSISIADGEAMMQGRFVKMPFGTSEEVTIENGSQGNYRNDLICIRYEKSNVDATESTSLVVIKGTETTGTPSDPTYNNGSITDGDDNILDFPLFRVKLNGINIESVTTLFVVKVSMVDYMDNYQMPVASSSRYGAVKIGSGITNNNGVISVNKATSVASENTDPVTSGAVYSAMKNGTVTKLGQNTVGELMRPIYLEAGIPKAGYALVAYNDEALMENTTTLGAQSTDTIYSIPIPNKQSRINILAIAGVPFKKNGMAYNVHNNVDAQIINMGKGSSGISISVSFKNRSNASVEINGLYVIVLAYTSSNY